MGILETVTVLPLHPTQDYCLRMARILTTLLKDYKKSDHLQVILATISGLRITVVVTATTLQAPRHSREP